MEPTCDSSEIQRHECTPEQRLMTEDQSNINEREINYDECLNKVRETIIIIKEQESQTTRKQAKENPKKGKKRPTHYPFLIFVICITQIVIYRITDCNLISLLCYSPKNRSQLWRLLTYSFLHGNTCHLALNLANLLVFGSTFEMEHGFLKASLIYMTGAIAGALGFDFFDRTQRMIGASGACSAFLMAHLSYLLLNWKRTEYKNYRRAVVISFAISDIISGPFSRILNMEQNLSWTSHMSAGVNGFILGLLILDSGNQRILIKLRCVIIALYVMISELFIIQYVPFIMDTLYRHSKRYNY